MNHFKLISYIFRETLKMKTFSLLWLIINAIDCSESQYSSRNQFEPQHTQTPTDLYLDLEKVHNLIQDSSRLQYTNRQKESVQYLKNISKNNRELSQRRKLVEIRRLNHQKKHLELEKHFQKPDLAIVISCLCGFSIILVLLPCVHSYHLLVAK